MTALPTVWHEPGLAARQPAKRPGGGRARRDEAMRLLASVDHGRVVFTRAALPAIRPVNHLVVDGRVIGRTRLTAKVSVAVRSSADAGVVVAYEATTLIRGVGRGGVWW